MRDDINYGNSDGDEIFDKGCKCGNPATQEIISKSKYIYSNKEHEAGDVAYEKPVVYVCDECAITYFVVEPNLKKEPTREALLGLPEKIKPSSVDTSEVKPADKSCKTCLHRTGRNCDRTGYMCSTEIRYGGECSKGRDLVLWSPRQRGGMLM